MGPKKKSNKKPTPSETTDTQTDILLIDSSESTITPRCASLKLILKGTPPGFGEYTINAYFNGIMLLTGKWSDGEILKVDVLPINLNERNIQVMIANSPLMLLLRSVGGKVAKDIDPLGHPDNRAGASVDLFPLLLGEEKVFIKSPLVTLATGESVDCSVVVQVISPGTKDSNLVPLALTMISVNCLPPAKEGTFYTCAIGLNEIHEPVVINFNLSLSTPIAEKIVFAAVNAAGNAANTAINVHTDDKFIPNDLRLKEKPTCRSFYWNAMRRVLVDPELLYKRLSSPFMIEIAGVPRFGKPDIRGRYTGFVDAGVLLEPGQMGVTVCARLFNYNEAKIPENMSPLLDIPPNSAKTTAREVDPDVIDELGHNAYAVMRFDLSEPLVPQTNLDKLYDIIGFPMSADGNFTPNKSGCNPADVTVDVNMIRKEEGALAVHKELSGLACKGSIPMNQSIKRTAANHLLMRVRAMLKSFPPGECSYIDYEDTVTGHHAASRRAVTASFAPQPPPLRLPDKLAAARCRIAADNKIANKHLEVSLNIAKSRPNALISKTIRCLEEQNNVAAKQYLLEGLKNLTTNRYLHWIYGGIEFDEENEGNLDIAGAALRLAAKGNKDYSDGTSNAIGWAALHTFHHCNDNIYAAFVSVKKMRKAFSLPVEWDKVLERWTEDSGEEEVYWTPEVISNDNPFLLAAAFFLCLRCYRFSEKLLQCAEQGCLIQGSSGIKCKITPDVYYLRAASHILRCELRPAMVKIQQAVKKFGPTPKISQIRATCLARSRHWDKECEKALREAEQSGAVLCSSVLYLAALSGFKLDPETALQRAARAHKNNPSGHTALLIGRIYVALNKYWFAERWLTTAVNHEPLLADGWAMLSLLAMYDRNFNKANVMYRTAKQAGHISKDIDDEVKRVRSIVDLDELPDILVKNLCMKPYLS